MKEFTCWGLYLQDFFILTCKISRDQSGTKKSYPFSFEGIQTLKDDIGENCKIGIFALDSRKLYSFLFTENKIFTNPANLTYVFGANNRAFRDLDFKKATPEEAIAMILAADQSQIDNAENKSPENKMTIPSEYISYSDFYIQFLETLRFPRPGNITNSLKQLNLISDMDKCTIDIYGTCMTRFLESYFPAWLEIKHRITNQTMMSSVTDPVAIEEDQIVAVFNNLPKKHIIDIFGKSSIAALKKNPGEYFIFDLLLETDMARLLDFEGKYVPYSWEVLQSKFSNLPASKFIAPHEITKEELFRYVDCFIKFLLQNYQEENIIIHKCNYSQYLLGVQNAQHIEAPKIFDEGQRHQIMSERLAQCYDYIKTKLPKAYMIDIIDQFACRNWLNVGVHAGHLQPEYYEAVVEKIKNHIFKKEIAG